MKIQWKKLILCLAIPLIIGGVSAFFTRNSMEIYNQMDKPPLTPPGWVFPIVWSALYILMGIASYLVLTSGKTKKNIGIALTVYGLQLIVNFLWPIFFFYFHLPLFSFIWLVFLWLLIGITIVLFSRISTHAANLLIPYLLWVTFAGYLNFGIYLAATSYPL